MSSSVNEDQDQRNSAGLEDVTTMTIESLRARLLSERAISKASKQRADELAKRVVELEEQLKLVSLQRKKAEKATADVLAILESNGMSDASEAFDSSSDRETIVSDSKLINDPAKRKETSSNFEVRRNDMEEYSSSEIDSSPSTGRSLSWKSSKDNMHSLERKKYVESVRRRCSTFTSNGSLPKRVGKSCRRIRRRETRPVAEDLHDHASTHDFHGNTADICSEDSPNCADVEHPANNGIKDLPEAPVSGLKRNSVPDVSFSSRNEQDDGMKRALEHQVQTMVHCGAVDRADREWEEKVKESSSNALDLSDPGNRSDVTEERDEVKASGQSSPAGMINQEAPASEFTFPTSKGTYSQVFSANVEKTQFQSSHVHLVSHGSPGNPSSMNVPFLSENNEEGSGNGKELVFMPEKPSSNLESVLKALQQARLSLNQKLNDMPPLEVGSSSKATEPSVPGNRTGNGMEIPVGCPGLFRLPTDYQFEATCKINYLSSNSALSSANRYPEPASDKFLYSPFVEPRSGAFLGDRFSNRSPTPFTDIRPGFHGSSSPFTLVASGPHTSTTPFTEIRQGIPASRSLFEPALGAGLSSSGRSTFLDRKMNAELIPALDSSLSSSGRSSYLDPQTNAGPNPTSDLVLSSSGRSSSLDPQMNAGLVLPRKYTYPAYHPFYPDVSPQVPPPNERLPRNVSTMEFGIASPPRFSFYDDHIRPNMYK